MKNDEGLVWLVVLNEFERLMYQWWGMARGIVVSWTMVAWNGLVVGGQGFNETRWW